jgi:hypothetical protein
MSVTYTNRKGITYYLCQGVTKTGKPRYYFAREPKGKLVDEIPEGYEISESVNGIVSLAKKRPKLIRTEEVAAVEAAVQRHPKSGNYRVSVKDNRIDIYELVGPDADHLISVLGEMRLGQLDPDLANRLRAEQERYGRFAPVLRFTLRVGDAEQRTFYVQRMCYLGSVDDWITIGPSGSIDQLARQLIPKLGTDAFFELY